MLSEELNNEQQQNTRLLRVANVVYLLQALTFVVGFSFLAGVIINYIKYDEVKGTWLQSHFKWQVRTFWYGLLWSVIGFVLVFVLIGWLVWLLNSIWIIYRIVRGWLALNDGRPMYCK